MHICAYCQEKKLNAPNQQRRIGGPLVADQMGPVLDPRPPPFRRPDIDFLANIQFREKDCR